MIKMFFTLCAELKICTDCSEFEIESVESVFDAAIGSNLPRFYFTLFLLASHSMHRELPGQSVYPQLSSLASSQQGLSDLSP
jgi:hypothetical protein